MRAYAFVLLAFLGAQPAPSRLEDLLQSVPADSLVGPLTRLEAERRGAEAAEVAIALGHLHYARGEYRQAAGAFSRAVSRSASRDRYEPRYWLGLSLLGSGDLGQARSAFEAAARGGSPRRAEAMLGVAICWETGRRPERALETLQTLLAGDPGEAGPAALERLAGIATTLNRPELARRARERLAREYPRSVETVRVASAPAEAASPAARPTTAHPVQATRPEPPPTAAPATLALQIGAFRDAAAARDLARRATAAGFRPVRVATVRDAGSVMYAVRVGVYATVEDARGAGERLTRALGVTCRVVPGR